MPMLKDFSKKNISIFIITAFFVAGAFYLLKNILNIGLDLIFINNENNRIDFESQTLKNILEIRNKRTERLIKENTLPIFDNNFSIIKDGKFILANLSLMKLYLYEDGSVQKEFNISAKGLEGSRYETPTGLYSIDYKEKNHYIVSKEIYMPYSMHFFGNFFIHGKPYYKKDNKPLSDGPSGGCIRMETDEAEDVHNFSDKNTKLYIIEPKKIDFKEVKKLIDKKQQNVFIADSITAYNYLVASLEDGFIFSQKNIDEKVSIFNLTKLMSAVVSDELFRDDHKIQIDSFIENEIATSTSVKNGDIFTITETLYPLIFEDDDLTAYSIASNVGVGYFVNTLNQKARSINMPNTKFTNPAGRGDTNISTAKDLFYLTKNLNDKHSYISKLTMKSEYVLSADTDSAKYHWINKNKTQIKNLKVFKITENKLTKKSSAIAVLNLEIMGKTKPVAFVLIESENIDLDIASLVEGVVNQYK